MPLWLGLTLGFTTLLLTILSAWQTSAIPKLKDDMWFIEKDFDIMYQDLQSLETRLDLSQKSKQPQE